MGSDCINLVRSNVGSESKDYINRKSKVGVGDSSGEKLQCKD